jgi:hypothetical protein
MKKKGLCENTAKRNRLKHRVLGGFSHLWGAKMVKYTYKKLTEAGANECQSQDKKYITKSSSKNITKNN